MSSVGLKIKLAKLLRLKKSGNKINADSNFYKLGYEKCCSNNYCQIFMPKLHHKRILAILDDVIVTGYLQKDPIHFCLYPDRNIQSVCFKVSLCPKIFPGLIPNSEISNVLLLRYMRSTSQKKKIKSWRLVVITNKAQIFHNFPSRSKLCDGPFCESDLLKFEESVVWDIPERKYPSKLENCLPCEYYFPCLDDDRYEYHPLPNDAQSFVDRFGNGGFPRTKKVFRDGFETWLSRFYIPTRSKNTNPFSFMGGFTNDYQATTIGTYQSALLEGTRISFFISYDGGREWFCKYDFGDFCEYNFLENECGFDVFNGGSPINLSNFNDEKINLYIRRRKVLASDKECNIEWDEPVFIELIEPGKPMIIKTRDKHNLKTNEAISLFSNSQTNYWFVSKCLSGNNYILFKVKVIDEYTVSLFEFVANPNNPICCRHIHHINRVKDGWILGTGEIYPNGWILYFQLKEGDYFTKEFHDEFGRLKPLILNHSKNSVQRTMGVLLEDNDNNSIIFALDHSFLSRPEVSRFKISRNSNGIFKGKLDDIDDLMKFENIFESNEVTYLFQKISGVFVFCGQLGELGMSYDDGTTWNRFHLRDTLIHYNGSFENGFAIEGYVFSFNVR